MSELPRRPVTAALVMLVLVVAGCGPRLHVERAQLTPLAEGQAPARLELTATYAGMTIDPRRPLRLHVGGDVRWVFLRPVAGASGVFAVDGSEHGYGVRLDTTARRVEVTEPVWPPTADGPVNVGIGQTQTTACSRVWIAHSDGGWAFTGRQESCRRR